MVQVIEPSVTETEITVASHCSFVTGDRLCIRCGYNLIGQSILREPHYNLLIARCPECGAAAGVQEYPLLGPWAHRWGMIIAALWFILIIGFWAGSSGTIMGLSMGAAEESGRNYERYISRLHDESVEQQKLLQQQAATQSQSNQPQSTENEEQEQEQESDLPTQADTTAPAPAENGPQPQAAPSLIPTIPPIPNLPAGTVTRIYTSGGIQTIIGGGTGGGDFGPWWKQQDQQAILASAGGWIGAVDWEIISIWAISAVLVFVIGCFWAVALVQLRRSRLLVWGLVILLLAWLFALAPLLDWLHSDPAYPWRAARQQLSPPLLICSLSLLTVPLALGLLLGRSIARQAVRGLLPPRLRGALALLWTTDGKRPPVGGYSTRINKA